MKRVWLQGRPSWRGHAYGPDTGMRTAALRPTGPQRAAVVQCAEQAGLTRVSSIAARRTFSLATLRRPACSHWAISLSSQRVEVLSTISSLPGRKVRGALPQVCPR